MPSPSRELWVSAECKWFEVKGMKAAFWCFIKCLRGWRWTCRCSRRIVLMSISFTQMQKYFLDLKNNMPSMSPVDKNWPARPYIFLDGVHRELQTIFHLWRVGRRSALCTPPSSCSLGFRMHPRLFLLLSCHLSNMESGFLVYNLALNK